MNKSNAELITVKEIPIYHDKDFGIKIYMSQLVNYYKDKVDNPDDDHGTLVWTSEICDDDIMNRRIILSSVNEDCALFVVKDCYYMTRRVKTTPLMIQFECDFDTVENPTPVTDDKPTEYSEDNEDECVYTDDPLIDLILQNVEKIFNETIRNSVPPLSNDVLLFMRISLNNSVAIAFGYKLKPWWVGGTLVHDDETDRCCTMAGRIFNRVMTQPDIVSRFQYTGLGLPGDGDDIYDTILRSAILAVQCVADTCGYTRETTPVATIYNDMKRALTDEFRKRGLLVDFMVDAIESKLKERIETIVDSIHTNL